ACSRAAPARTYPLHGQIIAIDADRKTLTIKHDDIEGLMPGMTMSFAVADPALMTGREPGEIVDGSLEVTDALARIASVRRVGFEALPTNTNAALMAAGVLNVGDEVPDTALIDQSDKRRALAEWRGSATLLTFIYTRCPLPDFCPLLDSHFARLQQAILADSTLHEKARLISVTFDPEHDTPAVLAAHAARLKADPAVWTFLTGDRGTLDRLAARLGVAVMRSDSDPSITHNLRTILIGPDGRIAHIYSGSEWNTASVLADLRTAAGGGQPQ
ncbi:MAG TPA: SCO family protein, partial [Vicinamibacterales bacterium]|nr:SCO family protein [Vicinamibacterales bacterium]